jgi:hypothetical protein
MTKKFQLLLKNFNCYPTFFEIIYPKKFSDLIDNHLISTIDITIEKINGHFQKIV